MPPQIPDCEMGFQHDKASVLPSSLDWFERHHDPSAVFSGRAPAWSLRPCALAPDQIVLKRYDRHHQCRRAVKRAPC